MSKLLTVSAYVFSPVLLVGIAAATVLAGVAMLVLVPFKAFREIMDESKIN